MFLEYVLEPKLNVRRTGAESCRVITASEWWIKYRRLTLMEMGYKDRILFQSENFVKHASEKSHDGTNFALFQMNKL